MSLLNIKLPNNEPAVTGKMITFEAPCNSVGLTGVIIEDIVYSLVDALGNAVKETAFIAGALVSIVIHTESKKAFIQNPAVSIDEEDLKEAVDNALSEAKNNGDFKGEDGTSVTITEVVESAEDGGSNTIKFSDGTVVTVKNGTKGTDGHIGKDGTSVTVQSVEESDTDGGSNTITFSDGKTITIKNGKTGSKGNDGAPATINGVNALTIEGGAGIAITQEGTTLILSSNNEGTITGVSANGTSIATSGVANIPAASTSKYGVTKLSSSTSSTSTTLAATASAVKSAYDLAKSKAPAYTYGTEDLVAGTSSLTTGTLYFVYE